MKRQRYDYSGFSLRRLNEPRFSHLMLLVSWPVYFLMYLITDNLIPIERCHPVHCWLDDVIPFHEGFAIFYVGWYLLIAGALIYTLRYDVEGFKKLQTFIIITQVVAVIWYILYPTRQDLRPEQFARSNVLTWIMGRIYSVDTSTGVCPSLHVGFSLAVLSTGLKDRHLSKGWKAALVFVVVMICLAVCFVKQHSAVDVFAAMLVGLLAEILVYGTDFWRSKRRKETK